MFAKKTDHFSADTFPANPRILVIRFKWIGDVMLTSVLANSLKRSFPESEVHYLMHEPSAALFTDHPYIDKVIALDDKTRKNPVAYWRKLSELKRQPYDLIVDAQATNKSQLVSARCAVPQAITIGRYKANRGKDYTHTVDATPKAGHKITERLKLLEPLEELGFEMVKDEQMAITVPAAKRQRYRQELLERGVDFTRPLFVFAVTAKLDYKKWRLQHIQEVAHHCLSKHNAQLVLYYGSQAELDDVDQFYAEMERNPDIITGIQTDDLMDLAALISQCQLFIGNEGGPRHIAQALNIPSIAVYSPSAKKSEWLPSTSRRHQGVEWDDLVDKPQAEKDRIHENLEIGGEEYQSLYRMITAQPVIELVDDVIDYVRSDSEFKRVSLNNA